uniref:Uncharacterized protein n=1 Tax=Anopheles farauti TaxID=69004 RepID=A0A182Q0Y3_9DIPT
MISVDGLVSSLHLVRIFVHRNGNFARYGAIWKNRVRNGERVHLTNTVLGSLGSLTGVLFGECHLHTHILLYFGYVELAAIVSVRLWCSSKGTTAGTICKSNEDSTYSFTSNVFDTSSSPSTSTEMFQTPSMGVGTIWRSPSNTPACSLAADHPRILLFCGSRIVTWMDCTCTGGFSSMSSSITRNRTVSPGLNTGLLSCTTPETDLLSYTSSASLWKLNPAIPSINGFDVTSWIGLLTIPKPCSGLMANPVKYHVVVESGTYSCKASFSVLPMDTFFHSHDSGKLVRYTLIDFHNSGNSICLRPVVFRKLKCTFERASGTEHGSFGHQLHPLTANLSLSRKVSVAYRQFHVSQCMLPYIDYSRVIRGVGIIDNFKRQV